MAMTPDNLLKQQQAARSLASNLAKAATIKGFGALPPPVMDTMTGSSFLVRHNGVMLAVMICAQDEEEGPLRGYIPRPG